MSHTTIRPADFLHVALAHPWRVVAPVAILTLAAVAYALMRPATWEASQALTVRDEAGDRLTRPTKAAHTDEMKTSQETIMELVKSRSVLSKALAEVGPPANFTGSWPDEQSLEALQSKVKLTPPKGAEFGKTEVFYLKVQDSSRQRAVDLASAICKQLQTRFAELREARAGSTTEELTKTVRLAHQDLENATAALREMEQRVGGDLGELRILTESPAGDSDLRRTATDLEKELRSYKAIQLESEAFLKLLRSAEHDADKLLASPSVLLKSQPALGRLKDGLVDAQLRTGQLLGTMSADHPSVKAARAAEQAIRDQLHNEIGVAIQGVEVELRVNADRIQALEEQQATIQDRFNRLASMRAEYANLVAATKYRGETLKAVEQELSESRASQKAALSASQINLVDTPDVGTRPVGPGRTTIAAAGMGAGVMVALAIVFLTAVPHTVPYAAPTHAAPVYAGPIADPARRAVPARAPAAAPLDRSINLSLKEALKRVSGGAI